MTYADDAALYRDTDFRTRAEMCIREQGYIFAGDGRPDIAALGRGVTGGDWNDIDAVLASCAAYSAAGDLTDDDALRQTVQTVWPTVAAARYPQT